MARHAFEGGGGNAGRANVAEQRCGGAMPLLDAAYMEYDKPQRLFMVSAVYVALSCAIWLGAQPWRLRDFLGWLFARPGRARGLGGAVAAYGVLLAIVAFTY